MLLNGQIMCITRPCESTYYTEGAPGLALHNKGEWPGHAIWGEESDSIEDEKMTQEDLPPIQFFPLKSLPVLELCDTDVTADSVLFLTLITAPFLWGYNETIRENLSFL